MVKFSAFCYFNYCRHIHYNVVRNMRIFILLQLGLSPVWILNRIARIVFWIITMARSKYYFFDEHEKSNTVCMIIYPSLFCQVVFIIIATQCIFAIARKITQKYTTKNIYVYTTIIRNTVQTLLMTHFTTFK